MNKKLTHSLLVASLLGTTLLAQEQLQTTEEKRDRLHSVRKAVDSVAKLEPKEVGITDSFKRMFTKGKVSGQVRGIYAAYDNKKQLTQDTYATALGGILKYELAEFQGFNAGVAFYTSQDLNFATGDGDKHNNELSSSDGSYTELSEAYINYRYDAFNFRGGRQTLDTPLADSDDVRMIQNTFEAYMASYNYAGIEMLGGYIYSWEGIDQDLDDGWAKIADDGVYLIGAQYSEIFEATAYYYNFTKRFNAFYIDAGIEYPLNQDFTIHALAQYLNESELNNSNIDASIYGGLVEFVAYGIGFNIAYNKADKSKESFSGTGGGKLFTSMDTMILDNIAINRDAYAVVSGISYGYKNFNFLYAYGSFQGDADAANVKENIVEQDIGFEYKLNEEFLVAAIYVMSEDKENTLKTDYDFNRAQVMLNYNF
jgi:hypothetical protein